MSYAVQVYNRLACVCLNGDVPPSTIFDRVRVRSCWGRLALRATESDEDLGREALLSLDAFVLDGLGRYTGGVTPMGLNVRSGIACLTNNLWYIGAPHTTDQIGDSDLGAALQRWTRNLFTTDFASSTGIRIILSTARLTGGQVDPSQPFTVEVQTTAFVYLTNWAVNPDNKLLQQVPHPPN